MIITKEELLKQHPCTTDRRLEEFLACFPDGIVTLEGSMKAVSSGYDLDWVARNLLPSVCREAYEEAIASAGRAYGEARASAERAYREAE